MSHSNLAFNFVPNEIIDASNIVAITEAQLAERTTRAPDLAEENKALVALAEEMAAHPQNVLNRLCELSMELCNAGSAGVSLLQSDGDEADFYWPVITGAWAQYMGGGMPRSESPCGLVLETDEVLMFQNVGDLFPAAAHGEPKIKEILLTPFHNRGKPIGTLWVLAHEDGRQFDSEDKRLLVSLSRFAAATYQITEADRSALEAQERLTLLNHELAHRLKNMLAMVMGIAGQTFRTVTEQDAVEAFQQRLQAMGHAHDILIDQSWTAAPIQLISARVLALIGQGDRIDLSGPDLTVGPRAALALSLILHELGTNAIKYGALSNECGRVSLQWNCEAANGEESLIVEWRESGGPPVSPPARKGFGTRLISMGLAGTGNVAVDYAPAGLSARFVVPLRLAQHA